jgi:hypothetical protein
MKIFLQSIGFWIILIDFDILITATLLKAVVWGQISSGRQNFNYTWNLLLKQVILIRQSPNIASGCLVSNHHAQYTVSNFSPVSTLSDRKTCMQELKLYIILTLYRVFCKSFPLAFMLDVREFTLSLSWARPIHSTPPHHISPRSILILSTHLQLGLPSGLSLSLSLSIYIYRCVCTRKGVGGQKRCIIWKCEASISL